MTGRQRGDHVPRAHSARDPEVMNAATQRVAKRRVINETPHKHAAVTAVRLIENHYCVNAAGEVKDAVSAGPAEVLSRRRHYNDRVAGASHGNWQRQSTKHRVAVVRGNVPGSSGSGFGHGCVENGSF
jgi:hypothetical protein